MTKQFLVCGFLLPGLLFLLMTYLPGAMAAEASSEPADAEHHSLVKWQSWSDDLFERAKQENKPVLLDLEAIWCHWCHVMDAKTYSDPKVAQELNDKFIAVKVDQDSRPDLSNRYEQYGWPATVIFQPSGKEIEIRSGFIQPGEMLSLLQQIAKHPDKVITALDKGPAKFSATGTLSDALRKELEKRHAEGYDTENGGWGFQQKFLDYATLEYAMARAQSGDKE